MEETNLKEHLDQELEEMAPNTILDPKYRKRKIIFWAFRTILMVALYIYLWQFEWVRWSLIIYVPLNLFGLFSILGWNIFLRRKIKKTYQKIEEADKLATELDENTDEL